MISEDILKKVKEITNKDNYTDAEEIIEDLLFEIEHLKNELEDAKDGIEDYDYYEDSVLGLLWEIEKSELNILYI